MVRCYQCGEDEALYCYFKIIKHNRGTDGSETNLGFRRFCSEECLVNYKNGRSDDSNNFFNASTGEYFKLYQMTRCMGFYDCEMLDNIRSICEGETEIIAPWVRPSPYGILSNLSTVRSIRGVSPKCEPADVGIIKSSVKLIESIEQFDIKMSTVNQNILQNASLSLQTNQDMLKNIQELSKVNQKMYDNTITSSRLNDEMLKHTKDMKWYTIAMFILTLVNVGLLIYQIVHGDK